jgi:hypothetical protein
MHFPIRAHSIRSCGRLAQEVEVSQAMIQPNSGDW